jgi:hypothetical protein
MRSDFILGVMIASGCETIFRINVLRMASFFRSVSSSLDSDDDDDDDEATPTAAVADELLLLLSLGDFADGGSAVVERALPLPVAVELEAPVVDDDDDDEEEE